MSGEHGCETFVLGVGCASRYGTLVFGGGRAMLMLVAGSIKLCGSFAYVVNEEGQITLHDTQQYIIRMREDKNDALMMYIKTDTSDNIAMFHRLGARVEKAAPAAPAVWHEQPEHNPWQPVPGVQFTRDQMMTYLGVTEI